MMYILKQWLCIAFNSRNTADCVEKSVIKVQSSKFIDTGGGFLLEEKVGEALDDEPVWIVGTGVKIYHNSFTPCVACNKYGTTKSVTKSGVDELP